MNLHTSSFTLIFLPVCFFTLSTRETKPLSCESLSFIHCFVDLGLKALLTVCLAGLSTIFFFTICEGMHSEHISQIFHSSKGEVQQRWQTRMIIMTKTQRNPMCLWGYDRRKQTLRFGEIKLSSQSLTQEVVMVDFLLNFSLSADLKTVVAKALDTQI